MTEETKLDERGEGKSAIFVDELGPPPGMTALRTGLPGDAQRSVSHWDEDPEFPVADWRTEVVNDDTRLGYLEWVTHQREAAGDETPSVNL